MLQWRHGTRSQRPPDATGNSGSRLGRQGRINLASPCLPKPPHDPDPVTAVTLLGRRVVDRGGHGPAGRVQPVAAAAGARASDRRPERTKRRLPPLRQPRRATARRGGLPHRASTARCYRHHRVTKAYLPAWAALRHEVSRPSEVVYYDTAYRTMSSYRLRAGSPVV